MIHISKRLYISNGDAINPKNMIFGTYKDNIQYCVGNFKIIFFTDKITDNLDSVSLLDLLNQGKFNFHFIEKYDTRDYLENMRSRLIYQIAEEEKQEALNKSKNQLFLEFNLSLELIERIKNLDIFYDYSDDIKVYNAGLERFNKLYNDLKEVNAEQVLRMYRNLITESSRK